jgi:glycerophosphoryl diester phosphodiesterase
MKRRKKTLKISIAVMLILVLAASGWIVHRGMSIRAAKEKAAAEAQAAEESQRKAEEDAAAAEDAKLDALASHVFARSGSPDIEEHSFKAYDSAIESGARYIEQDVVCTSDGVLYVSTDLNAIVMTGYNGMYEYISSETADSLRTDGGNPVLRLSQVFDKYGRGIKYVIELKDRRDACTEAFEELVDRYGFSDIIIVQSMYPEVLEDLESKYPDMPKLMVCWNQADFERNVEEPYIDMFSLKADAGLMTESNCKLTHSNGKLFGAWMLDDEKVIKKAIDMGVDNYFTNNAELALSIERSYGLNKR